MPTNANHSDTKVMSRSNFISMLRAAEETGSSRFLRQAATHWLAVFPGDLGVQLWMAKGLIADGKPSDGVNYLDKLVRVDPLFEDAYLALLDSNQTTLKKDDLQNALLALGSKTLNLKSSSSWIQGVQEARQAIQRNDFSAAFGYIENVLGTSDDPVIPAVYHLLIQGKFEGVFSARQLAELYSNRWPDCLYFKLILADFLMQQHDEVNGMNLLHQGVSIDSTGQVADQIWGNENPYASLWPKSFEVVFDLPIPAEVSNKLWGNKLGGGGMPASQDQVGDFSVNHRQSNDGEEVLSNDAVYPSSMEDVSAEIPVQQAEEFFITDVDQNTRAEYPDLVAGDDTSADSRVDLPPFLSDSKTKKKFRGSRTDEDEARDEFHKLSMHLKKQGLGDTRFPVYVILSSHLNLAKVYGEQTAGVLENEMTKLAGTFAKRAGWSSIVFLPDQSTCTDKYNIKPLEAIDPWKVKLAISDLDKALAKRGQMIGALLIVGGDEVIPFHRLPNPTDDTDSEVLSDNPYTTLDVNYFIPEWQTGRFPGEPGPDAGLLLKQLRQSVRYHSFQSKKHPAWPLFLNWINTMTIGEEPLTIGQKKSHNFGFTAAVWRRSSLAAFRPIGEGKDLFICPSQNSSDVDKKKLLNSPMTYYNLHGILDGAEWYGQKDPADRKQSVDFPIALSPADLEKVPSSPRIVFTEACYGGHTLNKNESQSLALKFISQGTVGLVSSTCISYGSISTPLIGADLLGNLFWRYVKEGLTTGEAMMKAKIDLVHEMNRRQGFLDGEDQKTLISFVLYGDPLISKKVITGHPKAIVRDTQPAVVKTICDRDGNTAELRETYGETIAKAKDILADFLPGLDNAEVKVSQQHAICNAKDHDCPNHDLGKQVQSGKSSNRTVLVFSKELPVMNRKMTQFARMTMDPSGKLVKLSISR